MTCKITTAQKLNDASKTIINEINGTIDIKLYISENLPDTLLQMKSYLEGLLKEYSKLSDGKITYTFINPDKSTKREYFFFQENFTRFQVVEEINNLFRYRNVFSGAIMYYGNQFIVIPEITPDMAIEYTITNNIKRLINDEKILIGLIHGHDEPTFTSFQVISEKYQDMYNFKPVDLKNNPDLSEFKALLFVSPRELIEINEFEVLDKYLQKGGNLFIAADKVIVDPLTKEGRSLITGLGEWLNKYGIILGKQFVLDYNSGLVIINQGTFKMPISLPYLPSIESFANHPVTHDISRIVFRFPSPLTCQSKELNCLPVIKTSSRSMLLSPPIIIDYNKIWNVQEFTEDNIVIGYSIEGKFGKKHESKIFIISDGEFLLNEGRDYSEDGENLELLFNAIQWLTDDIGLTELKTIDYQP